MSIAKSILQRSSTTSPANEVLFVNQALPGSTTATGSKHIYPKLSVGGADDPLEKEADAMADQVMRMEKPGPVSFSSSTGAVNPKCAECDEKEKQLQRKENSGEVVPTAPSIVQDVINSSGGRSLDSDTRSFMESRFNYDFSSVRIHDGDLAAESATSINALAYTSGNNVVFNSGQYNTNSDSGKRLLAHELTHVVQQSKTTQAKEIQRLVVKPHGTYTQGICGEYEKFWIFELSSPAPEDGYIVQQVDMYEDYKTCPGRGQELANPTSTFWEAWWLEKGDTRQHIHSKVGFTDRAGLDSHPGESGAHAAVGTIRFFKKSVTGDLGKENVVTSDPAIDWRPGNQGGVPLTGWLPSTRVRPSWWDRPTEGTGKRYATADWICCGDKSTFWSVSNATP